MKCILDVSFYFLKCSHFSAEKVCGSTVQKSTSPFFDEIMIHFYYEHKLNKLSPIFKQWANNQRLL